MDDELADLAERIRRAAVDGRAAAAVQAEDRSARLEAGRVARAALMSDLSTFGTALGVVDVESNGEALSWSFDGRAVVFEATGLGDRVAVTWRELTERTGRLYRESQLREKWVMTIEVGGREVEKVVFRNEGLLRLLEKGLRLPLPDLASLAPRAVAAAPAAPSGDEEASDGDAQDGGSEGPTRRL